MSDTSNADPARPEPKPDGESAPPLGCPVASMPRRPADVPVPERMSHLHRDHRGYPIIATIAQPASGPNFGAISEDRKLTLAAYDLCGVCALPFTADDLRWQVAFPAHTEFALADETDLPAVFAEAPAHRVCALYAAQVCPFVASPYARMSDGARRGLRRGETLALLGYRATSTVAVQESHIQDMHVLVFEMSGLEESLVLSNAAEAQEAYRVALEQDGPVLVDEETRVLVTQLTTPAEDEVEASPHLSGGVMSIGGVFLDDIDKVSNLDLMVNDAYRQVALHAAYNTGATTGGDSIDNPYLLAAHRWSAAHFNSLPPVLAQWQAQGRAVHPRTQHSAGGPRSSGRPAPAAKNSRGSAKKAKAQRAARRKNRR